MDRDGFIKITTATTRISVADPVANREQIELVIKNNTTSDIILTPESSIPGYSAGNLFHQDHLLDCCEQETWKAAGKVGKQLVIVGTPVRTDSALYNCAALLNMGEVIALMPKEFIPNYGEFREGLWYATARAEELPSTVLFGGKQVKFGTNLLFEFVNGKYIVCVGLDICEAIFMPIPPSSFAAIAGANILLNPSASPENIGKADYRENLVVGQSGRCIAAYGYASSGPTESTNDYVCGGHCIIAEAGRILKESDRVGTPGVINRDTYWITADVDVAKMQQERRRTTSFVESKKYLKGMVFERIPFELELNNNFRMARFIDARPFVPKDKATLEERCAEIVGIQVCGLAKRLEVIPGMLEGKVPLSIGISGGLDSTHAAGVLALALDRLGVSRSVVHARTMPGFGTTKKTRGNADIIMERLGFEPGTIDIRRMVFQHFRDIGHKPFGIDIAAMTLDEFNAALAELPDDAEDLVFENAQARYRTMCLMDLGFVIGTGDLSELWLGWCTYNADQQSMYNVNAGVPKTLIAFLVKYMAEHWANRGADALDMVPQHVAPNLATTMISVANTTISPELLPPAKDGTIKQATEGKIGPYELHDFIIFNIIRNGYGPRKIYRLMKEAQGWSREYTDEEYLKWLRVNFQRGFSQQFKRENMVDGPKVGSVCLSPRGDWVMPADASVKSWLREIDELG